MAAPERLHALHARASILFQKAVHLAEFIVGYTEHTNPQASSGTHFNLALQQETTHTHSLRLHIRHCSWCCECVHVYLDSWQLGEAMYRSTEWIGVPTAHDRGCLDHGQWVLEAPSCFLCHYSSWHTACSSRYVSVPRAQMCRARMTHPPPLPSTRSSSRPLPPSLPLLSPCRKHCELEKDSRRMTSVFMTVLEQVKVGRWVRQGGVAM